MIQDKMTADLKLRLLLTIVAALVFLIFSFSHWSAFDGILLLLMSLEYLTYSKEGRRPVDLDGKMTAARPATRLIVLGVVLSAICGLSSKEYVAVIAYPILSMAAPMLSFYEKTDEDRTKMQLYLFAVLLTILTIALGFLIHLPPDMTWGRQG